MDGMVIVNKPYNVTSNQVVQTMKRYFPGQKAGHTGTLDPMATGVLPVCLGKATRIAEYMLELPKTYRAEITLGISTDTDDALGKVLQQSEMPSLNQEEIESVMQSFRGIITQLTPRYSAAKYKGKALYRWAREKQEVPRRWRKVEIYALDILNLNFDRVPHLILQIHCSKGTYVRTLAADIGEKIGCGAHLSALQRLEVGPLTIEESYSLDHAAALAERGKQQCMIRPMDLALDHLPAVTLKEVLISALKMGQKPTVDDELLFRLKHLQEHTPIRVYDKNNRFRALVNIYTTGDYAFLKTCKYLAD